MHEAEVLVHFKFVFTKLAALQGFLERVSSLPSISTRAYDLYAISNYRESNFIDCRKCTKKKSSHSFTLYKTFEKGNFDLRKKKRRGSPHLVNNKISF